MNLNTPVRYENEGNHSKYPLFYFELYPYVRSNMQSGQYIYQHIIFVLTKDTAIPACSIDIFDYLSKMEFHANSIEIFLYLFISVRRKTFPIIPVFNLMRSNLKHR